MWLGPVLYIATSVFLWQYAGAVFMPELLARRLFALLPVFREIEIVVLINAALLYFAPYLIFAVMWERARVYLKHPFLAAAVLWLVNILVLFPLLGRGLLGYQLPRGWVAASLPMLVSHWMFGRGLQFQQKQRKSYE